MKFYQKSKRLVGHPADKSLNTDPILTEYFLFCEKYNMVPEPKLFEAVKGTSVTIKHLKLNDEKVVALVAIIKAF